jgi:hypothetical protein
MRVLSALAALLASPQALEATCLDAATLMRGVVVSFANGDATALDREPSSVTRAVSLERAAK